MNASQTSRRTGRSRRPGLWTMHPCRESYRGGRTPGLFRISVVMTFTDPTSQIPQHIPAELSRVLLDVWCTLATLNDTSSKL